MALNIKWIGSPNYRRLIGIPKRFVVMHWMVGTLASTDRVFQNDARDVATQYGIEDGVIHQYVKEKDYAFGSGTTYANTFGISIEHSGGDMLASGKRRKPSAATHETSARLLADISRRWKLGTLKVGKNVYPHSKFVPTACPGSLDLPLIVKRANEILATTPAPPKPKPVPPVIKLGSKGVWVRRLQNRLGLTVDGKFGPATLHAVKTFQRRKGLTVDGIVGPATWKALGW